MEGILIQTTTETIEEAKSISNTLIEKKIAACVTIVPNCISVYSWNNAIEESSEYELQIKTRPSLKEQIISEIKELSSYDIPQIIILPILEASEPYLKWMDSQLLNRED